MVDVKDLLLSGRSIASVANAELVGEDLSVADVQIDSRECGSGSLFVPLKGENTDGHFFIEEAAEAGKQIFCEKPIALDLAKIDRALTAVERAGVKLQIGFNRRFDPNFRRVRQVVAAGQIGHVSVAHVVERPVAH